MAYLIFPCRALYFTAYSQAKQFYNTLFTHESAPVHLCSAITAGMLHWGPLLLYMWLTWIPLVAGAVTTTCTSPLWVVKTQMQLEPGRRLKAHLCINQIYTLDGLRGFYRGLSASYAGNVCDVDLEGVMVYSSMCRHV